jgi:hypothetical protein
LAPPPVEVRREMLRLELEAQVANAQAEVEAMAADAAVEEGRPLAGTPGAVSPPSTTPASDATGVADGTDDQATTGETPSAPPA